MGRKIFITYKYADSGVAALPLMSALGLPTRARHYVDEVQRKLDEEDHINKGELDGEDLSQFTDLTIASRLRDKIFDSSTTIVLISKNMRNWLQNEENQWIPQEIAYSLKNMKRGDRHSPTNAMLAVILPDELGNYDHFVESLCANNCIRYLTNSTFGIIGRNMFNQKQPKLTSCNYHSSEGNLHSGDDHSFIYPVIWESFIGNVNLYLDRAMSIRDEVLNYNIYKSVSS